MSARTVKMFNPLPWPLFWDTVYNVPTTLLAMCSMCRWLDIARSSATLRTHRLQLPARRPRLVFCDSDSAITRWWFECFFVFGCKAICSVLVKKNQFPATITLTGDERFYHVLILVLRTDSTDPPDCLPILMSISLLFSFTFPLFTCWFRVVD